LDSVVGKIRTAGPFLRKYKLYHACEVLFNSPVEYLHYTLHSSQKNDFMFLYHNFIFHYDMIKRKSTIEA